MTTIDHTSSRKKQIVKVVVGVVVTSLFIFAAAYLNTIVLRSKGLHNQHVRWSGSAYRADPLYGYFPKAGATAFHNLKNGERIPVVFDRDGFRVPERKSAVIKQLDGGQKILFLGGSFTHGYGVRAEETFPFRTAQQLDAKAYNAGGSGWGLSQMLLRGRDVIPVLRPNIVIVEYSKRLASRSMRVYGPTNWARSPAPYFYKEAGQIHIQPPVFESMNFTLPIWETEKPGFTSFLLRVGIPLFVHDDVMSIVVKVKQKTGSLPSPAVSKREVETYVYNTLQNLCTEYGSKMMILSLPEHFNDRPRHKLKDSVAVPIVETLGPLRAKLPDNTKREWNRHYRLRSRDGSRLLDKHPSVRMHTAIAEVLTASIRQASPLNTSARTRP